VLSLLTDVPASTPVILIASKLDRVKARDQLLPWLKEMAARRKFAEVVPLTAKRVPDIARLLKTAEPYLPEGDWWYEEDTLTDRSERFLASEIIREKLFRLTGDELPYSSTVIIEQYEEEPGRTVARMLRIHAGVIVERDSHKAMVIGEDGEKLKRISTEARQDMEKLFDAKVYLRIWVKVKSGWADDEAKLKSYGYE
jgi:GTP-binding protein Era